MKFRRDVKEGEVKLNVFLGVSFAEVARAGPASSDEPLLRKASFPSLTHTWLYHEYHSIIKTH